MSNAFTKKYLTELIDGRIAAIGESPGINTEDEKLLVQMRVENILFEADQLTAHATKYSGELHDLLNRYEDGDHSQILMSGISELNGKLSYLTRYVTKKHTHDATGAVEDRIRKARMKSGGSNPAGEVERLERVKKYVTDSPAEEFSLTLMRSLGFLDIIKSAINN